MECPVDGVVGITECMVVGGVVAIGEGLPVGVELVGNVGGDGVGKVDGTTFSSLVLGKFIGEGVGKPNCPVVVGEAVIGGVVGGGEGSVDCAVFGIYVVGDIGGLLVGTIVGVVRGAVFGIRGGDVVGEGTEGIPVACE